MLKLYPRASALVVNFGNALYPYHISPLKHLLILILARLPPAVNATFKI